MQIIYMKTSFFSVLIMLFLSASFCFAQQKSFQNEVGFQTDNDSYLAQGSDRYYTNGLFLYFRHALATDTSQKNLYSKILGFEIGQKMYNPQGAQIPAARYVDRPFAAYLYAAGSLRYQFKNESSLLIGAQLGITGPAALGRQTQELVHRILGFYPPVGWQYQIRNNIGVNLNGSYDKLLYRYKSIDFAWNSYGNLGTTFTGAGAGLMLRLGRINPFYQSASTSTLVHKNSIKAAPAHEFFFYYKPVVNFILYDATVRGGLFDNDTNTIEITSHTKPAVLGQELGGYLTAGRWVFNLAATFKTREVVSMIKAHQWGSATFLYRFN